MAQPEKKAHPIKELLTMYDTRFQARFHEPAPIVGAKDAQLAKKTLARYPLDKLDGWLHTFFSMRDPFIVNSGYTFGVFVACLGKVIVAHQRQAPARPVRTNEERDLV